MKRIMLLVGLLTMVSCKGPKGDSGPQGAPGPGVIHLLSGSITSDTQTISDSRLNVNNSVTVYTGLGNVYHPIPIYAPGSGVNVFYLMNTGSVVIYNALSVGETVYQIVIVSRTAPMASMKERIIGG